MKLLLALVASLSIPTFAFATSVNLGSGVSGNSVPSVVVSQDGSGQINGTDGDSVLTSAYNSLPNGGEIFIKRGTYTFTATGTVTTFSHGGITIRGESLGSVYFNVTSTKSATSAQCIRLSSGPFTIENVVFTSTCLPTGAKHFIGPPNSVTAAVTVRHCEFDGPPTQRTSTQRPLQVWVTGAPLTITDCLFSGVSLVQASDAGPGRIVGNTFVNSPFKLTLNAGNNDGSVVADNKFSFSTNTTSNNGAVKAIDVDSCSGCQIRNNSIEFASTFHSGTTSSGIKLYGDTQGSGVSTGTIVAGNRIYSYTTTQGIWGLVSDDADGGGGNDSNQWLDNVVNLSSGTTQVYHPESVPTNEIVSQPSAGMGAMRIGFTKAQLGTATPVLNGTLGLDIRFCNDCNTTCGKIVYSSGTSAGQWACGADPTKGPQ